MNSSETAKHGSLTVPLVPLAQDYPPLHPAQQNALSAVSPATVCAGAHRPRALLPGDGNMSIGCARSAIRRRWRAVHRAPMP